MDTKAIIIPNKPQLDTICALYLLFHYGQDKFPGLRKAKIKFWDKASDPSNQEIAEFRKNNILPIEVGGGLFDHHNRENGRHETAAQLAAEFLGVAQNPELSALLGYIREDDLEGIHNRYGDFVHIIKNMYKQGHSPMEVLKFAMSILDVMQEAQKAWHIETAKEFEAQCQILKTKRYNRRLKIGLIESDNLQICNFGIVAKGMSAMIQKRSSGHVMIMTNKNHRIDLREAVAAIRKKELEAGGYAKEIDVEKLKFEGKSVLVPNWYYHRSLNAFLNGSDALSNTEPTKVEFNTIARFIAYSISTEESELCDCAQGGQTCPYRAYGFKKCLEKNRK